MKLAASDPTLNVKVKTKSKRKGGYPPWTDEDMANSRGGGRAAPASG